MQQTLDLDRYLVDKEIKKWQDSATNKGQVYTKPEVVNFMIMVAGLDDPEVLRTSTILEPSCGEGDFATAIIPRLIDLYRMSEISFENLCNSLLACDLVPESIELCKFKCRCLLAESNFFTERQINELCDTWFLCCDFLLADIKRTFTHIIGNPPYVRVEEVPKGLLEHYRIQYETMSERADLYVPFFQRSLEMLQSGGVLTFICTDRWMKNSYGKRLRNFISNGFNLELYIDLYGVQAFNTLVMTYPAITQIRKQNSIRTIVLKGSNFTTQQAFDIRKAIMGGSVKGLTERKDICNGSAPWIFGSSSQLELVRRLESDYPLMESAGCNVFIGTATGANRIYFIDKDMVGTTIEPDRCIPLITASEIKSGQINWKGKFLINTYDDEGVIDLHDYPKLETYLQVHKDTLSKRHIAKNSPQKWFKTIDRVWPERAYTPKLLIPDISNQVIAVFDDGKYHPNNSIYYICSDKWDLHALKVVLQSDLTRLFITTYSTKVANGYLRFQAQHLRKLRIPNWDFVDESLKNRLISAGNSDQRHLYNSLVSEVYNLKQDEKVLLDS